MADPQVGIWPGMSREEYDAVPALNNSGWERWLHPDQPEPDARQLLLGTVLHAAVGDIQRAREKCFVAPDVDRRTAEGKALWAKAVLENPDKWVLSLAECKQVGEMRYAIDRDHALSRMLQVPGETEVGVVWKDSTTGCYCKCLADKIAGDALIDWKTTYTGDTIAFEESIWKFAYHRQAAWYLWGLSVLTPQRNRRFLWACIQNHPPYATWWQEANSVQLKAGWRECAILLHAYARERGRCGDSGGDAGGGGNREGQGERAAEVQVPGDRADVRSAESPAGQAQAVSADELLDATSHHAPDEEPKLSGTPAHAD